MNPLYMQMLKSALRSFLIFGGGYFVAKGIMTEEQLNSSIGDLVEALVPLISALAAAHGMWNAKKQQQLLVTAQALPASVSTIEVIEASKKPNAPSAMIPRDVAPKPLPRSATKDTPDAA